MCMCAKPNINGQPGYSWDGKSVSTRPVNPPDLAEGDTILYDEPGRCGGLDSHSHHFRIVKAAVGYALLVRHGGGDERIDLGSRPGVESLSLLDSNARYWALQTLYHVQEQAARRARDKERETWRRAAAEKRIKTRKMPAQGYVKVWIEGLPLTACF